MAHPKLTYVNSYSQELAEIENTPDIDKRMEKLEIFCFSLKAFLQDNGLENLAPAKELIELYDDKRHLYEESAIIKRAKAILNYLAKKWNEPQNVKRIIIDPRRH